jgi:hypothetical protein
MYIIHVFLVKINRLLKITQRDSKWKGKKCIWENHFSIRPAESIGDKKILNWRSFLG